MPNPAFERDSPRSGRAPQLYVRTSMFEIPIPRIDFPKLPEIKSVSLSVSEVKEMSDEELLSVLSGESKHEGIVPLQLQQVITSELLRRNMERTSKPHWSVTPSFWLLIVGTSAACIAAYPVVFPQAQQSAVVVAPPAQTIQPASSMLSSSPPQLPRSQPPLKDTAKR